MNETRGNARTKPTNNNTNNLLPPNDFGLREPLKEREINSLKDSEKTKEYWCLCNKYNIFVNRPYKTKKEALKTLKFLKKSKNPKGWFIIKRKLIEIPLF